MKKYFGTVFEGLENFFHGSGAASTQCCSSSHQQLIVDLSENQTWVTQMKVCAFSTEPQMFGLSD